MCVSQQCFSFLNLPIQILRSDAIWEVSFFTRLVYAALIFVVFKTRVYRLVISLLFVIVLTNFSAWAIAESICVILGIGIYPAASNPKIIMGPTDLNAFDKLKTRENIEMSSDAIVNLDIPKVCPLFNYYFSFAFLLRLSFLMDSAMEWKLGTDRFKRGWLFMCIRALKWWEWRQLC